MRLPDSPQHLPARPNASYAAAPVVAAEQDAAAGISLLQVFCILRAHVRLSIAIVSGVLALTVAVLLVLPKSYSAIATLMITYQSRDPLAGEQVPLGLLGNYIATQAELITSPAILMPVVDQLNLTQNKDFTAGFRGGNAEALKDYVEKNLSKALVVNEGTGGEILYIQATSQTAAMAARLANTVTDVYLEQAMRRLSGPANERAALYAAHLTELRSKVEAAQEKVTQFRAKNHLTEGVGANLPNADVEAQALTALEGKLLDAQNARRAAEAHAAEAGSAGQASPLVERLKEELTLLEARLAELKSTYGPEHPKILEVESQIAARRASLDAEYRSISAGVTAEVKAARQLEQSYQHAVDQQRAKVLAVRTLQDDGAKLLLELESAQTVYRRALDGYDQIMFASTDDHTNVSVVSRALPPSAPSKSRKRKLLAAGMAGAIGLGLGIPLLYELLIDRRVRCRDDVERGFGLTVLAELGPLPRAVAKS